MYFSLASVAFGSRYVAQDLWLKICSLAFLAQGPRERFIMGGIILGEIIYSSRLKNFYKNLFKDPLSKQECGGVWSMRCNALHVTEYAFNAHHPICHSVCLVQHCTSKINADICAETEISQPTRSAKSFQLFLCRIPPQVLGPRS